MAMVAVLNSVAAAVRQFADGIDQTPCNGCDECGTRCTAGVRILRAEFDEIQAYLSSPAGSGVARVVAQNKRLPIPGTDETYQACRFRDTERGNCSIYPARPLICRLFGHVEWLPCPIGEVTKVESGAVELMQQYATEPRKTYEEWQAETPDTLSFGSFSAGL